MPATAANAWSVWNLSTTVKESSIPTPDNNCRRLKTKGGVYRAEGGGIDIPVLCSSAIGALTPGASDH